MTNAKSYVLYRGNAISTSKNPVAITSCDGSGLNPAQTQLHITYGIESFGSYASTVIIGYTGSGDVNKTVVKFAVDGVTVERSTSGDSLYIIYYNDTEIT